MATPDQAFSLLTNLAMELRRHHSVMWKYDDYYRGKHRLAFASDQFRKYFGGRYSDFADNWVQVVADAPVERMRVSGIRLAGEDAGFDKDLWDLWEQSDADEESSQAFLESVITGRAYAMVWGDEDDNPLITFEHPTQCIVAYDIETRQRKAGLKLWSDDDYAYATLYLPDEIWKFQQRQSEPFWQREFAGPYMQPQWELRELASGPNPMPNPLGAVPLVELQNRPRLIAEPMSDVAGAVAMQDALNLLWAYLFNAADFASLGQRIVTGAERPMVPILDDNGNPVGERPVDLEKFAIDRIIWLEDPNAKPAQWEAAQLEPFTRVIERGVTHLAAQTRTPTHYLVGQMANLSADALKAAETGLVKRTEEKTRNLGKGIREVFRLAALVQGNEAKAKAIAGGKVLWRDVESRSEAQLVDALLKLKQVGFPFEYLCERYGLSPNEIARVIALKQKEAESDPLSLLAAADPAMQVGLAESATGSLSGSQGVLNGSAITSSASPGGTPADSRPST